MKNLGAFIYKSRNEYYFKKNGEKVLAELKSAFACKSLEDVTFYRTKEHDLFLPWAVT